MEILKRIPKPSGSIPLDSSEERASREARGPAHPPRQKTRTRNPRHTKRAGKAGRATRQGPREPVSQAAFNATVEELLSQGFTERRGKPKTGERPLGPALAERFGLQIRQVRVLLRRRRAPFSKASVLPRPAAGAPPAAPPRETPAVYAARMKLQRALGTRVELHDQSATGIVVIHWSGYAHLEELMTKLGA